LQKLRDVIFMTATAPIVKPPRLRQGDLIGIISPAGPVNEPELQPGQKILRSSGFKVRLAPHVYDNRGYLAGDDEVRLDDLHDMFRDPKVKAIFCARGGYGSPRLLHKIRYNLIKDNPKIIVGYSDITSLLMAVYKKTGLITFHGPMVRDLAKNSCNNWDNLHRLLSADHLQSLNLREGTALKPGKVTGPLVGGNLSLICSLIGTPFLPSLDRCILFIEEKGEPLYRLDRMLTHLFLSGQLKHLSGLIAGQFEGCGDTAAINEMLMDIVSDLPIPFATGLPVGHGPENTAVPLGLMAELNTERMTLSIMETCTV
jgi:muramoyltetrapeptide carboxypeptidase